MGIGALARVWLQHGFDRLLELQEEGIVGIRHHQGDPASTPDAAHADNLDGRIVAHSGGVMVDRARNTACHAHAASRLSICTVLGIVASAFGVADAKAQEAEPRSYSNTPIGLNFLIGGYAYSEGKIAFDPDLAIANASFSSHTEAFAYVRSFDLGGQSAKFDVIVPASSFSAQALVNGQPAERQMSGLGDLRFRLSANLFGAPALSAKDFASYRQDIIVGVSIQVSAPLGQYDDSKLLNLGNNRWSFKPELGISKALGPWTFELAPSVTVFSGNRDFFGGNTFSQAPIYAVQGHILYNFQSGIWMALDGIYFAGGHTALNGVQSDNEQANTRAGFTLGVPIDRNNSLKLSASTGTTTRTGARFSAVGIAWQYRWGGGY
jgi:outer membrane putative beta-barrel porin/alpha-amylase